MSDKSRLVAPSASVPSHVRQNQRNTVVVNADTTYITITEDKAENILMKNWDGMKAHYRWQAPLASLTSLAFGMMTSDVTDDWHGIPKAALETMIWCAVVVSFLWLIWALIGLKKATSISRILQQLKNASTD